MAAARRRRPKPRTGGAGLKPLLALGVLLVGVAVLSIRTLASTDSRPAVAEPLPSTPIPTPMPTPMPAPTAAPPAPTSTRPAVRTTVASSTSTPARAAAVPSPTPTAVRPATLAPTAAAVATPDPKPPIAASPAGAKRVALTFDAGADRGYAEDILDLLQEQRVPASFGITANWARNNPDLVRRMGAEGHLVINHTLDHRSFTGVSDKLGGLSPARRRAELEEADAVISPLLGHSTRPWYRLPYGDDDARVASDVAPAGYTRKVGWTVDSLGWRGLAASDILARCLKLVAPGAVYVLHVGRDSQDGLALPRIVPGLRDQGYTFVTVEGL
jgi:peptidoglycan-N-acetylglucosamine deacetylase